MTTRFAGFTDEAFDFYLGLAADNSKQYWTDHKHVYAVYCVQWCAAGGG